MGGTAEVWGTGAAPTSHPVRIQPKCELCPCTKQKVKHVSSGGWALPRLLLISNPVCDIHGQDLKVQPGWGACQVQELQNYVPAFERCHGSFGDFGPWPPACAGTVCSRVRSGWYESQNLQVRGHGSLLEIDVFQQVGGEVLPQVRGVESSDVCVHARSCGEEWMQLEVWMEHSRLGLGLGIDLRLEIDRWFGAVSAEL